MSRSTPFGVLIDAEAYGMSPYGGLIRYWDRLIQGLDDRGIYVELIPPGRAKAALPELSPRRTARPARWIFHPTYLSSPPWRVDALALTAHDVIYEEFPRVAQAFDPTGASLAEKACRMADADLVIAPSKTTRTGLHRHYADASAKIEVISEGIDELFFDRPANRSRRDATRLRAQHGCRRPYLLHVGGRAHYKNFESLVATYVTGNLHRSFDLVVAGSQPHPLDGERALLQIAPPTARVAFLGQVDLVVLAALYRDAAVYVAPSLTEGFGFTPLEAAASGTPVAHADTAIFRETLGEDGFAFQPTDVASCERAITAASCSPEAHRNKVRAIVRRRFAWATAVDRTITAYDRALMAASRRVVDVRAAP